MANSPIKGYLITGISPVFLLSKSDVSKTLIYWTHVDSKPVDQAK